MKVTGSGTAEDPFRATEDVNGSPTGPDYAVTLTWEGPISSLQIAYRQGVRASMSGNPFIYLSPVTYTVATT